MVDSIAFVKLLCQKLKPKGFYVKKKTTRYLGREESDLALLRPDGMREIEVKTELELIRLLGLYLELNTKIVWA